MKNFNFITNWCSGNSEPVITSTKPVRNQYKTPLGFSRVAAVLCLLLTIGAGNAWGTSVTYRVSSASAVTTSSGTAPANSSASLSGSGSLNSGFIQCTNGNSHTLTLSGYNGYKITAISIVVKSNSSKGTGSFSVQAGSTTLATIAESAFNSANWNGAWSTSGVTKNLTMTNNSYEIQKNETVTFTISCKSGSSDYNSLYIQDWVITYEAVGGGCSNQVTITNSSTTDVSHGSFDVDKTGAQDACSALSVVVTPNPDDHYHVASVSATNPATTGTAGTAVDNGDGTYTITYSANAKGNSTISVTFEEDTKYTVTWSNNGSTSTTQVYSGEKPTLPANPTNCDATSDTFYGWSTTEWSGAIDDISAKTIYTDASAMPAVTGNGTVYYSVFAKAVKSDNYQLLTDDNDFISGEDYLIEEYYSYTDHVLKAANYNSKTYQQVSYNSWSLPNAGENFAMTDALFRWKITSEGNGQYSIYNASANKYLVLVDVVSSGTHYKNLILSATKDANFIRTVTESSGNSDSFTFESSSESGYYICCNGNYFQASSSTATQYLYKRVTTYSKYRTNCCTQLGTINGSFF